MNILIAGGTGFIGQSLVKYWHTQHQLTILGRESGKIREIYNDKANALTWSQLDQKSAPAQLSKYDIIINLAGDSIAGGLWTERRRQTLWNSRITPTQTLAHYLTPLAQKAPRLLNASGVGIYGFQTPLSGTLPAALDEGSEVVKETGRNHFHGFLSELGKAWEDAASSAIKSGVSVTFCRFGVVLAKTGGALPRMARPFYLGLGGRVGSGNQVISWISLDDCVRAFDFVVTHPDLTGPINFVSLKAVTQSEFAHTLAKILHRPAIFPLPEVAVRVLFGQMGNELLLNGQHVVPSKLINAGFQFHTPDLQSALKHIYTLRT